MHRRKKFWAAVARVVLALAGAVALTLLVWLRATDPLFMVREPNCFDPLLILMLSVFAFTLYRSALRDFLATRRFRLDAPVRPDDQPQPERSTGITTRPTDTSVFRRPGGSTHD